ncbi:heterodisulfide reductase-related iron-sulfur binding cluster [Xanthobacter versatilis]|uniref:heterodisulfide reductase-related iron-sulfur binding cluster n=1 Tax=Xanthobacter autotrophicus (strain ATCC BAA-1158 / Py2) TaxID=78245 RepID=UPI0037263D75
MIPNGIEPSQVTRILFQDFSPWMLALFYVYAIGAIFAFCWGIYVQVRKYRSGRNGARLSWANLGRRLADTAKVIASHRTLRRRDAAAGRLHAFIFYGFTLLFIGTATITLQEDILGPLVGLNFWHGHFYLLFKLAMTIAGTGFICGLAYMMWRRGWLRLPKLDYTRPDRTPQDADFSRERYRMEDWAFLWTLLLIGITGFLLSGARMVWLQGDPAVWDTRWWAPVGASIAAGLKAVGFTSAGAGALRMGLWWVHGVLALTFIALIPYTKAKHIFTAATSWLLRDSDAARRLPLGDLDADRIGYRELGDVASRYLVQADACTKCGRCHEACPARAAGYPLSPRDVVLTLREQANAHLGEVLPKPRAAGCASPLIGLASGEIRPETLWSCRQCGACTEICPVGVEHVPLINMLRRTLVDEGEMDPALQRTLGAVNKTGNCFNESRRKRPNWTKDLPFKIKDARKEPVDVLWFVGDYASFDPRNQKVSRAFARILHAAGIDFGILYEGETTAGNDVRRVGEEGLFQQLAEGNIATLEGCAFARIVTTDPHSFNTLKNEYPDLGGAYTVSHASAFLKELIEEGRIAPARKLDFTVTYHDPCHLGRLNKGYDAPREVLAATGVKLVELGKSRDNSFCCGGGGGRVWVPDPPGTTKVGEIRAREAAEISGLDALVVNCPKCMTMLEDAVKTTGNERNFRVLELTELLAEALEPAEPVALAAPAAVV